MTIKCKRLEIRYWYIHILMIYSVSLKPTCTECCKPLHMLFSGFVDLEVFLQDSQYPQNQTSGSVASSLLTTETVFWKKKILHLYFTYINIFLLHFLFFIYCWINCLTAQSTCKWYFKRTCRSQLLFNNP